MAVEVKGGVKVAVKERVAIGVEQKLKLKCGVVAKERVAEEIGVVKSLTYMRSQLLFPIGRQMGG